MQLGQAPRQRQAETGTLMRASETGVNLAKRLQCDFDFCCSQTRPGIPYLECDAALTGALHRQRDRAAGPGELDGVRQKIEENFL